MSDLLAGLDADVICEAEPQTEEWFAARRCGITATDAVKALGFAPQYGNQLTIFHDKRGELPPDEAGEAAEWGNILEDVIAQKWAWDNGIGVRRVGIMANRERPWMLASLDRLNDSCPDGDGPCWTEVKNRSEYKAGSFREEIPDDVLTQTVWQGLVSGLPHGHVVVLIGGNRLRSLRYDRDADLEAYVFAECEALWNTIQSGVPPVVDASTMLLDLLDRLHPNRDGATEIDRTEYLKLKSEYDEAHQTETLAAGGKAWAAYRLITALGGGDTLVAADDPAQVLATYKPRAHTSTDTDRLKAEFPDAHKACVKRGQTKPSLTWKKV